jgi:protein-tyrosine phosphatase
MPEQSHVAWIELEGARNVRDLGDLPARHGRTRRRRLLRSDALDALTGADVARLVDDVGIVHVIDLRSRLERAERGRGLLGAGAVTYSELDVVNEQVLSRRSKDRATAFATGIEPHIIIADGYVELLELGGQAFGGALERLVAPGGLPALVHCAIGKDRTGVLIALLLDAAGVDRAAIVADYARTGERMRVIIERIQSSRAFDNMARQIPAFVFEARAETMERFLQRLDDIWGGAEGYFAAQGVGADVIERWRAELIEG